MMGSIGSIKNISAKWPVSGQLVTRTIATLLSLGCLALGTLPRH
jgi:hypothetical protein